MRFEHRIRQERALAVHGDVTDSFEGVDGLVLGRVPAGCFQPVGHALRTFDQELLPLLGLVRRRTRGWESRSAGSDPLDGPERDCEQQPADFVQFDRLRSGMELVLSSKGQGWQRHAVAQFRSIGKRECCGPETRRGRIRNPGLQGRTDADRTKSRPGNLDGAGPASPDINKPNNAGIGRDMSIVGSAATADSPGESPARILPASGSTRLAASSASATNGPT